MGERVCGFPGKKLRSLFLGLEGYNRSLFGLLMGCGGTIVEGGGRWSGVSALALRGSEASIFTSRTNKHFLYASPMQ